MRVDFILDGHVVDGDLWNSSPVEVLSKAQILSGSVGENENDGPFPETLNPIERNPSVEPLLTRQMYTELLSNLPPARYVPSEEKAMESS